MDVQVELSRIIITELGDQQIIVLSETGGPRSFPIAIGIAEALAIDRQIKGIRMARPMTHDLLASVISELGGELERIVIDDLRDGTFFAKLHIRRDGELIKVDARPSDAIALGSGGDTPIFVAEHVLNEAGQGPP